MRSHLAPFIAFLLLWPMACPAQPQFSEAVGLLSQERSYAESGAALAKRYAPDDIEARRLYANARAAFDGLIAQLLADLALNRDPQLSGMFRDRLDIAVRQRFTFSEHVNDLLKRGVPDGAKPALIDALAKLPVELIKELLDGGMAIWKEWREVDSERRKQLITLIEAQRWKPFSDISSSI
jgi:hypothetical protein